MAKDQNAIQTELRRRTPLRTGSGSGSGGGAPTADAAPKKPFNPVQFLAEVRAEGRKITWTTWKETWITSIMVGIMVVLTALFFFTVDGALSFVVRQVLQWRLGS